MSALVMMSEEKLTVLAHARAWSMERARGFVEGEACRRRDGVVSTYWMIGIDDYAVGFRTGYFERLPG